MQSFNEKTCLCSSCKEMFFELKKRPGLTLVRIRSLKAQRRKGIHVIEILCVLAALREKKVLLALLCVSVADFLTEADQSSASEDK